MYDWKLRLSKRVDVWTVVLCWAITIFDTIASFIVYSVASSYDLYFPEESAAMRALEAFFYVGSISVIVTILLLRDRNIARKSARDQQIPSNFIPPDFKFKKRNILRLISIALILFFSLPWIFALVGIYISDIPGLGLIFLGKQPSDGLPSVHLGTHHGLWACQFAIIAIILTILLDSPYYLKNKLSRSIIVGMIVFLAGFAIINGLEDGLNEQVWNRGINLVTYDIIYAIYSMEVAFYSVLGIIAVITIILWYRSASKKEKTQI